MSTRALVLRLLVLLISIALFLASGEAMLRVIYRDAGETTLGGPGGHAFEHLTVRDDLRGRFDTGPKRAGVRRIMILGDSISWGQGVRNWQDVWPEQLATALERAGTPSEMAVLAMPGRGIGTHVGEMERWAPIVQPDVVIYQWYVNDVEVLEHRPRNERWWQRLALHGRLRRSSYLYYFLDNRFSTFLPQPDRSYVQYILEDFIPGTLEWSEFERYFHALATRAKEAAPTRVLLLYPQVPFRDRSPLQPIHERMHALAGAHRLSIPPAAWVRWAGAPVERADARWHQAIQIAAAAPGPVIETREYYLSPGPAEAIVTLAVTTATPASVASLEIIDHATNQVITTAAFPPAGEGGWRDVPVRFAVPGPAGRDIRFRVASAGGAGFELASLDLPVDYGMRVVDLTADLNTFNTHASIFDAHPNARAHGVIARKVLEALQNPHSPD